MTAEQAHAGSSRLRNLDVPAGWKVDRTWGPWPFTTHALLAAPDGTEVEWTSRRHRKHLGLRALDPRSHRRRTTGANPSSWWMGALFMVGSFCFALGSFPPYFENIDAEVVAWTFFVGSIFFTSAAYLQFHEAVSAPTGVLSDSPRPRRLAALIGWEPHNIDWWACAVQLVGTLFFNVSTFAATRSDLSFDQERHLIWGQDVWGSACFLIASWLAYSEVNPRILPSRERDTGWWIAALNLLGSIAFGASAIAARYVDTAGDVANIRLVNLGTFVGALCFFAGAALLPVESARDATGDMVAA